MMLTSLTLHNFRSYSKKTWVFSPGVTCIIGPNAVGKTNIVEAIMMLATGKSFRAGLDREVIRWEQDMARIKAETEDGELEIVLTGGSVGGKLTPLKKYVVRGVSRRMVDFVGNLRAVLFWPEDLKVVTDSPGIRRRYLDTVLLQADREYRRNLVSYERGLRQRNRLLDRIYEGKASRGQLLFWDQLLIRTGTYLTNARHAFIEFIGTTALMDHPFTIEYDKSVISVARLEQYKNEEIAAKATLVGPHRDDFRVMQDGKDISMYGSRGEQRIAVLWLKLAEIDYIEQRTRNRPILLLDDIFSELDETHRTLVVGVIQKQQTVVTSAARDMIATLPKQTQIISV